MRGGGQTKKKYKKRESRPQSDASKKLGDEISDHYASRGIGPEKTQQIEEMLKEGIAVSEICEKVGVSNPTVYVIKTRLKQSNAL